MLKLNKIYHSDCIDLMSEIEDQTIDLIVADPPYNLRKNFGNDSDLWETFEDWLEWTKKWIFESKRILKPTGSIFIYGIHHYLCYLQVYLYEIGMYYRRQIIWHYENGFSGYKNGPAATYEPLLWFSKSNDFVYNPIREPYKSQKRLKNKIYKNGKVWEPHPEGKHAGDVWKFPTLAGSRFKNEKVDHPTQKPLSISNRIIQHFSLPNSIVYIPFAGSGSECVSCKSNKRNFIASEINSNYINIANKRLQKTKIQYSFFEDQ
ncbi:MAG: site-specific DNA-methyltransferase [Bacteroidales bacterium]|nr:site-specific DNA-methyltransferase [Bacteroidales bacterium]MCF8338399.1 site-specific DNA-methyltransferase [Bacteroidales bacterium]